MVLSDTKKCEIGRQVSVPDNEQMSFKLKRDVITY